MEVKRLQSDLGDRPDKTAIADAAIAMMQARASGATAAEQAAACVDAYITTTAREQNEQHWCEQNADDDPQPTVIQNDNRTKGET